MLPSILDEYRRHHPDQMVRATIVIQLLGEDIDGADDDLIQAVQNVIGHTGAQVIEVEEI